ncbi:dihydrofolate reductase [uncultured bacterium]|nr:dihydrofolate reductase [uncultured bacterium]
MLTYVWAQDKNGTIGKNGGLPWHLPADMHHFQKLTTGHAMLAGRTTFESFGRPLLHRKNMVLTSHPKKDFPDNVTVFNTPNSFLKYADAHPDDKICIVGGAQIFKLFLPYVDFLCRTVINGTFDGDTKMPKIDYSKFELVKAVNGQPDQKNHYAYRFETYRRI